MYEYTHDEKSQWSRYSVAMNLSFRDLGGTGEPIVILHGLFGSSQNWVGMGRRLLPFGHVFSLDLRNHGDSPQAPSHTLADCVQDLAEWAGARGLQHGRHLRLIGHSMGGLVAMGFAIKHPEATAGVASIDIAPRPYPPEHGEELRAMKADISACRSRADLDTRLMPIIPETRMRQFLLTNAVRQGEGFRWKPNVAVLEGSTVASDWASVSGKFDGEALLIAGARSGYVREEDHAVMRRYFPLARIETLPEADHWPHVTAPDALEAVLGQFLERCNKAAAGPSGSM
jgi:pimeloyl-ACP methyl ester carboxylesterase